MFRSVLVFLTILATAVPIPAQTSTSVDLHALSRQSDRAREGGFLHLPARLIIRDVPLNKGLMALQERSGAPMAFSPTRVAREGTVSCDCDDVTVRDALDQMLSHTSFGFTVVGDRILIERKGVANGSADKVGQHLVRLEAPDIVRPAFAMPRSPITLSPSQTGTVEGQVLASGTRRPLQGAQVFIREFELGAVAGRDGRFRIPDVPVGEVEVSATMLGHTPAVRTVSVRENETTNVAFELTEVPIGLEAVVATVEAVQMRRREVGTDIGSIDVDRAMSRGAFTNMVGLLQARTPGVSVSGGSGLVGQGARVRIRGVTSLTQGNEPLLVIDGVRASNNTTFGTSHTTGQGTSRLDDLNPNEIDNIQIIKGPAATALYGSEAAPGVIVVTTKRGQAGTPRFQFVTRQGVTDNPWAYPDNYADVTTFYGVTDPNDARLSQFRTDQNPLTGTVFLVHNPFEESGTNLFRSGHMQEYNGSIQGGVGEDVAYYVSGGYSNQQGVIRTNAVERFNLRANADFPGPWDGVTFSAQFGIVASERGYPLDGSPASGIGVAGFLGSPVAAFGNDPQKGPGQGICARDALEGRETGFCDGRNGNFGRTFDKILTTDHGESVFRTTGSLNMAWMPRDWFVNRFTVGLDRVSRDHWSRTPFDPDMPFGRSSLGSVTERNFSSMHLTLDYTGTLQGRWGEDLERWTTFGGQFFRSTDDFVICSGIEYPNNEVRGCGQAFFNSGGSGFREQREAGAFLLQRLGYRGFLYGTGGVRVDDNASLGEDVGAIWSPSANVSWVVTDMPAWGGPAFIDNLRFRAAWGTASQSPQPFEALQTYLAAPVTIGGQVTGGVTPAGPGNPDLGPERSEEVELGFDGSFFADRVGLAFTYFNVNTRDLIVASRVAPSSGFPGERPVNLGLMNNKGFELSVSATLLRGSDYAFGVDFNHSRADPIIKDVGLPAPIIFPTGTDGSSRFVGSQIFASGVAPGAYISPVVGSATRDSEGNIVDFELLPGTLGDGSDLRVVGSPHPAGEQSIISTFTWRSLSVSAQVDRAIGVDMINATQGFKTPFSTGAQAGSFSREYAFRQVESTPEQQAMIEEGYAAAFVESGAYTKLREVNVRHELPESVAQWLGASRGSISVAGRNLKTWSDFSILDPEMNIQGNRDNFVRNNFAVTFPPTRSFWVDISLVF